MIAVTFSKNQKIKYETVTTFGENVGQFCLRLKILLVQIVALTF